MATLLEMRQEEGIKNARAEIVEALKQEGVTLPDDEQLDAMAKQAVDVYDNDYNRALCWSHAIGEAILSVFPQFYD